METVKNLIAFAGVLFLAFGSWTIPDLVSGWWANSNRAVPRPTVDDVENRTKTYERWSIESDTLYRTGRKIGFAVMTVVDLSLLYLWWLWGFGWN